MGISGSSSFLAAVAIITGLSSGVAAARDLTVVSWGGNYQDVQREIYFEPFSEQNETPILEESWNGGYGVLAAQMQGGAPSWDVIQVEAEELELGCFDGIYETIDWEMMGGEDQFFDSTVSECGVGAIVWSTVLAYDGDRLDAEIDGWEDFWDIETYPGSRGLRRGPKLTLEIALMADGVPPEDVYDTLRTDEGVDRAFAKLDEIKNDIVWWEAGAQPLQLLASGELAMTAAYSGRIFAANETEDRNFEVVWNGSIYAVDSWVVLSGSPNKDAAMEFIRFASLAENQAKMPPEIPYGMSNVDVSNMLSDDVLEQLPTAPANLEGALETDVNFWVDNVEELTGRFNAWLAQ
ncbi:putative spermidine/putrescine transport system substrate-binding protein [Palleronia aestuarii]|uniref:Putative spermidine/putrescine transport system substrate-binding protein n=1 Tax=Palleronia aestuarii TaxID=568105 RepID=A0A2W7N8R7_9RHOB|nr:ABC transporter substrate-binding protein [Palleronia aestuarii]PZX16478.1 putative spermidine/putrescine transport system substrate-binding protein [Palleronia aestuarii]